jgi:NuA3 HAT complex component NTO1
MVDAPEEAQIIVADQSDGEAAANIGEAEPDDPMDTDAAPHIQANIEVSMSEHENDASSKLNGVVSSSGSPVGERFQSSEVQVDGASHKRVNGFKKVDSGSPPLLAVFGSAGLQPPQHSGPLTPPQSNGSFGRDPANMLSEGGMPWYLQGFDLKGTSAVEEQWTGRDAVRSLSEELTDMDDDALKDLEFDVDDDTITASPVNAGADSEIVDTTVSSVKAARKRERANPAKFRKGVRSSARRR